MNDTVVTIVGNVCDEPTRRQLDSGTPVVNFRLASTARRFDRGSNAWTDGDSVYVAVACWRGLAENVVRSLTKGDPVVVHGRLVTRSYEVNGQKRSSFELVAYSVGHDLARGTTTFHRAGGAVGATYEIVDAAPATGDDSAESEGGIAPSDEAVDALPARVA